MPEKPATFALFKPPQPRIPGVPERPAANPEAQDERPGQAPPAANAPTTPARLSDAPKVQNSALAMPRWVLPALAAIVFIFFAAMWMHRPRTTTASPSDSGEVQHAAASSAGAALPASKHLAIAPGEVATTDELAKPWSSREFEYDDRQSGLSFPAMVVHLPGGQYWAFSLQEPFGQCRLAYVTDLGALRDVYGFAATHPMVVDTCSHAVYDLLRYGSAPRGMVRGEIVQGSGLRPPIAIEVRVQGKKVLALRSE